MAIVVRKILASGDGVVTARVEHGGQEFIALVSGSKSELEATVGTALVVEIEFREVLASRTLESDSPEWHGLFPTDSDAVRLVGSIHSIVDIPGEPALVDVYIRTGPEFVAFRANKLGCHPRVGCGFDAVVSGLCFIPTPEATSIQRSRE